MVKVRNTCFHVVYTLKHVTGNPVIPAVLWNVVSVSKLGVSQDIQFRICHSSGKGEDVSVLDVWHAQFGGENYIFSYCGRYCFMFI